MKPLLLTVREAARMLGVHENTVRNIEQRGQLAAVRLPSGVRRFRSEDVQRMRNEMWSQFAPDTEMPAAQRNARGRTVDGEVLP